MGHHLKVILVDTQAVVAPVVNLLLSRDETKMVGIDHEMNCNGLTVQAHSWIPTTSAIPGIRPLPDVAGIWGSFDLETKMDDFHLGSDPSEDVFTPAHDQISVVISFRPVKFFGRLALTSTLTTTQTSPTSVIKASPRPTLLVGSSNVYVAVEPF